MSFIFPFQILRFYIYYNIIQYQNYLNNMIIPNYVMMTNKIDIVISKQPYIHMSFTTNQLLIPAKQKNQKALLYNQFKISKQFIYFHKECVHS